MALSAFTDKAHNRPTRISGPFWARRTPPGFGLLNLFLIGSSQARRFGGFTSANTGWGLRLKRNDRVILYMTPREDHFLVSFALGEKAVVATRAHKLTISAEICRGPRSQA